MFALGVIGGGVLTLGLAVRAETRQRREFRLMSYAMALKAWEIKQNVAAARFLRGESDEHGLTPPPRWEDYAS